MNCLKQTRITGSANVTFKPVWFVKLTKRLKLGELDIQKWYNVVLLKARSM